MSVSTSVKKAFDYIVNILHTTSYQCGDRFLSVRDLAEKLHLSRNTIQSAIALCAQKKILVVEKRKAVRVGNVQGLLSYTHNKPASGPKVKKPENTKYRWEKTVQSIKEDILNGTFRHTQNGKVPSIKELMSRYNATYLPIIKALSFLQKEGLLSSNRTIEILSPVRKEGSSTIVLIVDELHAIKETISDRQYNFLRMIEIECQNAHIHLEMLQSSENMQQKVADLSKKCMLLGFIVKSVDRETLRTKLFFLGSYNLPVAVIKEGELEPLPFAKRYVKTFSFGDIDSAGKQVARHLLAYHHTQIAFISCFPHWEFSIKRYSSLAQTFGSASARHTVVPFLPDAPEDISPSTAPIGKNSLLYSHKDLKTILDTINRIGPRVLKEPGFIPEMYGLFFMKNLFFRKDSYYRMLWPLFTRALACPDLTAWVCADDLMALPALEFLAHHGKKVPDDISVVGFEDIYEALPNGLTTYNFNVPALVSRCLKYIQFPSIEHSISRSNKPVEIVGHVIERRTTGPAK